MSTSTGRRLRADAEHNIARILAAAEEVLAVDPAASLEQIGEAAGLTRATVHRRFASRQALLEALTERLNQRYLSALDQSKAETAPPLVVLRRLTEIVFELKISHRFTMELMSARDGCRSGLSPEVEAGLEQVFVRLREAGEITATGADWCRQVYLALLHEAHELPDDAADLVAAGRSRAELVVRAVVGALGGAPSPVGG
ncbi:TetR/AcrR family transcriptional regulator [Lentzea nigeriaca]|uniref:TetR/AcrR family transcriptional regulator n=1 Tax=Lentzea nigeriaca TaxID=1128665 RepID=UPI001957DB5B|nr:TetR/AcrR family transcriptional regulator [Lentzea nigeriaca]MBM7857086.1 AcrR family transcriptional regulator [Lentzea nigeriaca]